jgi:UDP-GlcNAc:undecaprenyl-phosphate GlcNAc-1-phosphate transferase
VGGIAIALAFYLGILFMYLMGSRLSNEVIAEPKFFCILTGAYVAFLTGLWDDVRRLNYKIKFLLQSVAATTLWLGGVRITAFSLPGVGAFDLTWISLPLTIFWVLLVINAINLIDGLDGLAAGVSFFVSTVLLVLTVINQVFVVAVTLAALAGATLGFLRYNFNPARIFMGDGGSYFLGFMLSALSMLGSIKSQAALSLLIPIIALGLPLMDTLWAPLRRFLLGRKLFSPDREHFHHRLLQLGLNQRHAVLTLYAVTISLGLMAVALVHTRDERAALLLVLVAAAAILGLGKLGYFRTLNAKNFYEWLRDISDESGISHERRSFLDLQLRIANSRTIEALWEAIVAAFSKLEFDSVCLYCNLHAVHSVKIAGASAIAPERRHVPPEHSSVLMRRQAPEFQWRNEAFNEPESVCGRCLFRLELPLMVGRHVHGTLLAIKDLEKGEISHYTLKRLEHLRRGITRGLERIAARGGH